MSIEEKAAENFRKAKLELLAIPRPFFRRKVFVEEFNDLIARGEIKFPEESQE